ncbi:hypothetical protein ABZ816_08615 [Actinosynnema sp. NPDC047251]|uniref:DUF7336 domain-containing protein n=1 Tax=Saccharothrix espanaensis (strain ATCC 51144 / DSM 44229 / JCM 9112 / NBRC 15066 / NRRL 15764) TaxID=1179773 RepID=K0K8K0_SACES|nr:hypothetical protein [Saccharothrix espanaensis]CCH33872.1 hypothetical protein BN6_66350 [Saccharothrix espanaensis DSM 44229]
MEVFLLWHVRHARNLDGSIEHVDVGGALSWDEEEGDDVKLLGVYSTENRAHERIERARTTPGFADEPNCFMVERYVVDQDTWTEGFTTVFR